MANFFDRSRYFGGLDRAAGNGWHGGGRRQSWQPGIVNQPPAPPPSPPVTGLPINAMLAQAGQQPRPIVSQVPHLPPGPPVLPPPAAATSLPLAPDGVLVGAALPPPPVTAFGTAAPAQPPAAPPVQQAPQQAQPALTPDGAPTAPQGPPVQAQAQAQAQAQQQAAPVAPVAQALTANVGQPGMVQRQPQSDDEQRRQQQGTPQQADYMKPLARMAGGGSA